MLNASAQPCTMYHVMYHVPCTMYHVPCTMYHVPCTMYHVPCTMYHVPCTMYHVPFIHNLTVHIQPNSDISDVDEIFSDVSEMDDGYYNVVEKAIYEKPKPKPDNTVTDVQWQKGGLLGSGKDNYIERICNSYLKDCLTSLLGAFGKVFLGLNVNTGELIAVKQVSLIGDHQNKEVKHVFSSVVSFVLSHLLRRHNFFPLFTFLFTLF